MTELAPRLRTELWVKAQIRICDVNSIPAFVRRRGDAEAGTVILLIDDLNGGIQILSAAYDADGQRGWIAANGKTPMTAQDIEAYIDRRLNIDPDVWVVEIEDVKNAYELDGPRLD